MEKILPSIIAAFLPFLFTFLSKKNKDNRRRNLLEEAQNRVNFIKSYFDAHAMVSVSTEKESLKGQLANELVEIKNNINILYKHESISDYEKLGIVQMLFLTFKPSAFIGWVWHILFYINLIFVFFLSIGLFVDEKNEFHSAQFSKNLENTTLLIGSVFYIFTLVLFNRLAIRNFKKINIQKSSASLVIIPT